MITTRQLTAMFIAAATAITMAGCGTTDPQAPLITTPKVGSGYTFENYQKDSTGHIDQSTKTVSTSSVTSVNTAVLGKTDVVRYMEGVDTMDLHFQANGDVDMRQPALILPSPALPYINIPSRWVVLPYGSKALTTIPGMDTTISIPMIPLPIAVKATGNVVYIGTEDLKVGTNTVATQKALMTINVSFNALILNGTVVSTDTLWFAPKLGMIVKDDGLQQGNLPAQLGGNGILGGTYRILTDFSLK
ncbi:MAG: hypothetical protein ABIR47_10115 [Candidatus Kapaibacterium sp.]